MTDIVPPAKQRPALSRFVVRPPPPPDRRSTIGREHLARHRHQAPNRRAQHERRLVIVLGVDIGTQGAIALLDESGDLLEAFDIAHPRRWAQGPQERQRAAPGRDRPARRGKSRLFRMGRAKAFGWRRTGVRLRPVKGVVEGVLAAHGVPVAFLTPPQWKRLVGIAPGKAGAKDAARSEAIRRWPAKAALFSRIRDDGRAEAALIAIAGLKREGATAWGGRAS